MTTPEVTGVSAGLTIENKEVAGVSAKATIVPSQAIGLSARVQISSQAADNKVQATASNVLTTPNAQSKLTITVQNLHQDPNLQQGLNKEVFVYNNCGTFANYCKMDANQQNTVSKAHAAMRNLIAPNSTAFSIHLSKMVISYKEGGVEQMKDLAELIQNNPTCKQLYKELTGEVHQIWGGNFQSSALEAGRKTTSQGSRPQLKLLSTTFTKGVKMALNQQNDPSKQDDVLKLITAAEKLMQTKHIDEKLEQLKSQPSTPLIETSISELERLKKKQEMDRLAIYLILANYPTFNPNTSSSQRIAEVTAAAERVKEYVQAIIDQQSSLLQKMNNSFRSYLPSFIPEPIRVPKQSIPASGSFSGDVAGLMFAALPVSERRSGYIDFCHKHGLLPKADCMEDSLLRFVLGSETTIPELESMINSLSDPAIKQACEAEFEAARSILTDPLPAPAVGTTPPTLDEKISHLQNHFTFA